MRYCCYIGVTVVALGGVLLAGCASSPHGKAPQTVNSATVDSAMVAEGAEVDQKQVEAHAHYALGTMYDLDDDSEKALEEFSQAALDDPANEELVLELSHRYLERKQPDQALELLKRATAVPEASGALFARLGLVYAKLGKDDLAVTANETAIKRAPILLAGYQELFIIHLQKGRVPAARTVLDEAAKQTGASVEFLVGLAELYTALERQAPSLKDAASSATKAVLQRAVKHHPTDPQIRLRLADGFNLLGDSADATQIYLQLLDQFADADLTALRDQVRARLADIYLRGHEPNKAAEQLKAIIQDDPANAQAYYYLGSLAYDAKKLAEAEDYFTKTLLLSDDFEQAYYDLAGVQVNLDQAPAALATLAKAHEKFHENFMSEFLTALAYSAEKDYTNAANHFTSAELMASTSEPSRLNQFFYYQAGATYERKGDYEQAEAYFGKALERQPDFAEALNYYGYMLADRGVKLARARELIEKAVKLEPQNPAYLDSLGWVLYKLGQPGAALPPELKSIELSDEPDPTLYDHLGDIYAALKQPDKARAAWQKALAIEPNEGIKKKLAAGK